MEAQTFYRQCLQDVKLMQLATCQDNKPWLCNVWFVADGEDTIYWMSRKIRRHSEDIAANPQASCTFHKWFEGGFGEKGQALVMAGKAELVPEEKVADVYDLYTGRHPHLKNVQSKEKFQTAEEPHFLYQLTPDEIVWFDEINFPDDPRKVLK
ncbi:MAG: pyridoxamine 5'-phosphate oxidase family protein [Alphaproteobacteria bacterium]|nr:pyridoxamine 5'-phosphate oxidase family protein [Alphaproteobacteria bacterium]MDD9919192.1 pyridoxamine 5'-phosphate oxidase family protein [Alphaproteobacteria bacterium]